MLVQGWAWQLNLLSRVYYGFGHRTAAMNSFFLSLDLSNERTNDRGMSCECCGGILGVKFLITWTVQEELVILRVISVDSLAETNDQLIKRPEGPHVYTGRLYKNKYHETDKGHQKKHKRQSQRCRQRFLKKQRKEIIEEKEDIVDKSIFDGDEMEGDREKSWHYTHGRHEWIHWWFWRSLIFFVKQINWSIPSLYWIQLRRGYYIYMVIKTYWSYTHNTKFSGIGNPSRTQLVQSKVY